MVIQVWNPNTQEAAKPFITLHYFLHTLWPLCEENENILYISSHTNFFYNFHVVIVLVTVSFNANPMAFLRIGFKNIKQSTALQKMPSIYKTELTHAPTSSVFL